MENTRRGPLIPASVMHNKIVNNAFDGVLLLAAFFVVARQQEVIGALVFLGVVGVMLIVSDRLSDVWVPLILMTVFLTRCYDSYDTFIRFAPYIGAVIGAVVFHIIYYWEKPTVGPSFYGLCAVAVAVTFGGAFYISAADYFRPIMLYYVGCLGVLMPLLYLVAKPKADGAARERFLRGLFFAGCLAVFVVAALYIREWEFFKITSYKARWFQSSNNLATFLMIAMPTGFYYSRKCRWLIASPALMYLTIVFCNSRGGIVLGTVEFFALLIFFCFYRSDPFSRVVFASCALAMVVLFFVFLPRLVVFCKVEIPMDGLTRFDLIRALFRGLTDQSEPRINLLSRALADFRSNPLFGTGLGYRGNSDIYNPVRGAMNWYHMWGPQILGSMGVLGVLCYGYQLYGRIRLAFSQRELTEVTLSLCYLGLFMMSQVNPGEFCPFPYAITATLIFILIEPNEPAKGADPAPDPAQSTPETQSDPPQSAVETEVDDSQR